MPKSSTKSDHYVILLHVKVDSHMSYNWDEADFQNSVVPDPLL